MVRDYVYVILFCVGLAVPCYSYGQSQADSLQQELKDTRGLERAELLIELSGHTRQTDVKKAITQVDEARNIANRLGDEKLEARSLSKLGFYHTIQDKSTEALEDYLLALELNRQNGFRLQEAVVLHQLGRFYDGQENYSKALEYYFKSLRISEAEGDQTHSAETLYYIGIVYDVRNEIDDALMFYKQAYDLAKEIENYRQISIAASGIAILYQKRDSLKAALSYYEKAMDAAKAINSTHAQATILLHMSSAYQDQKLFEQALALNNRQIELASTENSSFLEAQGLANLADLYREQGNLERSNQHYHEAKLLYEEIGYTESNLITSNKLARNFLQQERLGEAIEAGRETLEEAKISSSLEQMKSALEVLVQAYTQHGDYQNAFRTQEELTAVKDSLYSREREKQIAQMQTRYETEQKEREIALLQAGQERSRLLRNALIAGLILITIIGILIYNRQRLKIKKNHTELENTRLKEKQLKQDLEFKNKQLTTHSLNLVQKNETMKELKESISKISQKDGAVASKDLQSLKSLIDYSFNLDDDWEEFRLYFEKVHTGFFDVLKDRYPELTSSELRLSALVKLNLTTKEIATIMGITPDSVKTARYRLRKKLDMETEENLTEFMMNLEKKASET